MLFSALLSAVLFANLVDLGFSSGKVFYVKPTVPTTECPSPCHSLQYYANHSSFTNSSRFTFLEGEHHLYSMVEIRNVANLSLAGASLGVKLICKSGPSGFHLENFTRLSIENMSITNCSGSDDISLSLFAGSELSLSRIEIVTSSGHYGTGLMASNIVGSFTIFGSTFFSPQGSNLKVNYSQPGYFNFSKNELCTEDGTELHIGIYCSNVHVLIEDSIFENASEVGLSIDYSVFTNNSVLVSNGTFRGEVTVMCSDCADRNLQCYGTWLRFTRTTFNFSAVFDFPSATVKDCTLLIQDSFFSSQSQVSFTFTYDVRRNSNDTVQIVLENSTFISNNNGKDSSVVSLLNTAGLLVNCTFENNTGSPIHAQNSKVVFEGDTTFRNNSALFGAGMQLLGSHLHLRSSTRILFMDNHADYVGGAIYTNIKDQCFFQMDAPVSKNNTVEVKFIGNTADFAGSSLFGYIVHCCQSAPCEHFYEIFNTSNTESNPSAIASVPSDICFCADIEHSPNCSQFNRIYSIHAFPGQDFTVPLAVVGGWSHGIVTGAVRAYSSNATLGPEQVFQTSNTTYCKNFHYSVSSKENSTVTFRLIPEQYFFDYISDGNEQVLSVTVYLKKCPLGFSLSLASSCVCDSRLSNHKIKCNINDQSISRPANSWIGFIGEPSTASGVMFHPNCPIGYCLPHDVYITSNTSDRQCEPHRTGRLCGMCAKGYSLTLGSQKCKACSNTYLLLIVPFAASGLLLVAILLALKLTVTEGSINGLIFYSNVMVMNHTILFSRETSYLYIFLAWLNLDIGISTCLFDGMDGYVETWLQFVFPLYLWVIVLVIILFYSKFSVIANKLGGENALQVLATLLLLSYTKLQRTVVTILSFTWLEYPDGAFRCVWLYDANVEFFKGKHLYLGIAGISVLFFLITPYTLCLTFFQQLQACSGHRLFQWVNKLKPVFDAYAGPYKDKYRFWTGMLLSVRTLLIILFTINTAGSADFNLLVILVVSCALLMANSSGIYRKWPYDFLESFFYLQLAVFAGGVLYTTRCDHDNVTAVADTSIGLSLVVLVAVMGYHLYIRISTFRTSYYKLSGYADIEEESYSSLTHDRLE